MPSFPIDAQWTKLAVFPDEPPIMAISDGEGHSVPDIEGLQTGRVWQAEEVRRGDGWRRYYRLEMSVDELKTRDGKPGAVEVDFPVVAREAG